MNNAPKVTYQIVTHRLRAIFLYTYSFYFFFFKFIFFFFSKILCISKCTARTYRAMPLYEKKKISANIVICFPNKSARLNGFAGMNVNYRLNYVHAAGGGRAASVPVIVNLPAFCRGIYNC